MSSREDAALDLSSPLVADIAADFDLSDKTISAAEELALTVDQEYAINRQPRTIAIACLYIQSMWHNEKITQGELHRVTGIQPHTVSVCYREIVREEGLPVTLPGEGETVEPKIEQSTIVDRVLPWR